MSEDSSNDLGTDLGRELRVLGCTIHAREAILGARCAERAHGGREGGIPRHRRGGRARGMSRHVGYRRGLYSSIYALYQLYVSMNDLIICDDASIELRRASV